MKIFVVLFIHEEAGSATKLVTVNQLQAEQYVERFDNYDHFSENFEYSFGLYDSAKIETWENGRRIATKRYVASDEKPNNFTEL